MWFATGTIPPNCCYQIKLIVNGLWNISFVSLAPTLWLLSFLSRPIRWKESSLSGKHQCQIKPGSAWARLHPLNLHSENSQKSQVKGHMLPLRQIVCDGQPPELEKGKERGWRTLVNTSRRWMWDFFKGTREVMQRVLCYKPVLNA